jgi:hypothetical protein
MALKDIGKIVANQGAQAEDARAAANTPTSQGPQWEPNIDLSKHEPADVAGHRGFKYDSANPFHKDFLTTLLKSGDAGKMVIHEGGALSVPAKVAMKEGISKKFEVATDFGGGEKRYEGLTPKPSTAVTPAPRTSEKDAKKPGRRPAAPRPVKPVSPVTAVTDKVGLQKEDIAALFKGANSRVTPESIELEKKKKADAEAADKAARAAARKKMLEED